MVCLDTNFLIDLIKKEPDAETKLQQFQDNGEHLSTTAITAAELYVGAYDTSKPDMEINLIEGILNSLKVLNLTKNAAEIFGKIKNTKDIKPKQGRDLDLLIASIVLSANESLLTRNHRDFANVEGLEVETW